MNKFRREQRIVAILLSIFLLLTTGACQSSTHSPEPSGVSQGEKQESTAENVQVARTNPEKSLGATEHFPLPNCGGTGELSQSLGTQASVKKRVAVGGKVTTSGGVEVSIPEAVKLKLEAEVELTYQQEYEMANSRLDTIRMAAAKETHVVYVVQWEEQTFESIVTFEMDGQVFETPYTYVLRVPKLHDSFAVECPLVNAAAPDIAAPTEQTNSAQESDQLTSLGSTSSPAESSEITSQQAQCQWLKDNFPQSQEEVISEFNLPTNTVVSFIYELCPSIANAFGVKASNPLELQVPLGGCIDSWSGFTEYIGDVGTPVPDGWGGWRVYQGTVRAPEMTYRIIGCP